MGNRASAQASATWTTGVNVGNVPWEFQTAKGEIVGFEIDLLRDVARRAGRSVRIENVPFNGLFSAVQSGRIQIALSSITVTPKRLASLGFSQAHYDADQSVSVPAKSPVRSLADLAGRTVGVDTASTGDIWATQHTATYKFANVARYEGLAPAMLDLANGRIDAYVSDLPAVAYYIKDKPQYRVAARIATGERYAFMHARDFTDAAAMNAALTEAKRDGTTARLHATWFGSAPAADSATVKVLDVPKA